jgi:hypothetical protein
MSRNLQLAHNSQLMVIIQPNKKCKILQQAVGQKKAGQLVFV